MKPLMTLEDCAELLQVKPEQIRRWIKLGRFPAVRIGKQTLRVDPDDFDTFIAGAKQHAGERG